MVKSTESQYPQQRPLFLRFAFKAAKKPGNPFGPEKILIAAAEGKPRHAGYDAGRPGEARE